MRLGVRFARLPWPLRVALPLLGGLAAGGALAAWAPAWLVVTFVVAAFVVVVAVGASVDRDLRRARGYLAELEVLERRLRDDD